VDSLERAGFLIFTATHHSQDALGKIRVGACRVALVDRQLPGLDGVAFPGQSLAEKSHPIPAADVVSSFR